MESGGNNKPGGWTEAGPIISLGGALVLLVGAFGIEKWDDFGLFGKSGFIGVEAIIALVTVWLARYDRERAAIGSFYKAGSRDSRRED